MQIANVALSYRSFQISYQKTEILKNNDEKSEGITSDSRDYNVSLTANFQVKNLNAVYTKGNNKVTKNTEESEIDNVAENSQESLGSTKAEIRKQIELQTYQLLQKYLDEFPDVKQSLSEFFINNPKALEQIQRGEIPEYFNVDNTAKRILDIYFSQYSGEDKAEFAERAKSIISQAYGEVEGMVGTLPDIVLQTRDKVYEILDKFTNGEDVSDFINVPTVSNQETSEVK